MNKKLVYQAKIDAQLHEWQEKIDILKARADQAEAEQKLQYLKEIESLHAKQQQLHDKLDELHSASEDTWDEVKSGVEKAGQDLENAFERAMIRFR